MSSQQVGEGGPSVPADGACCTHNSTADVTDIAAYMLVVQLGYQGKQSPSKLITSTKAPAHSPGQHSCLSIIRHDCTAVPHIRDKQEAVNQEGHQGSAPRLQPSCQQLTLQ
jgi:hypothetical protein